VVLYLSIRETLLSSRDTSHINHINSNVCTFRTIDLPLSTPPFFLFDEQEQYKVALQRVQVRNQEGG